jgi:hypothetical protein
MKSEVLVIVKTSDDQKLTMRVPVGFIPEALSELYDIADELGYKRPYQRDFVWSLWNGK